MVLFPSRGGLESKFTSVIPQNCLESIDAGNKQ